MDGRVRILSVTLLWSVLLLQGCSGGGGNDDEGGDDDIAPPPGSYTVSATVTGVAGHVQANEHAWFTLHYTDQAGAEQVDSIGTNADGPFTFRSGFLPNGSSYRVEFRDADRFAVRCSVANGAGTIAAANVTDVAITCVPAYTVGGSIKGIVLSVFTGLGLQTLHNAQPAPPQATVYHYSTNVVHPFYTGGNEGFLPGDGYDISVSAQPADSDATCFVRNGSGTVAEADVVDADVLCSGISLDYTVTGLSGSGLTVRLSAESVVAGNGSMEMLAEQAIGRNGHHRFETVLFPGQRYRLEIQQQPTDPQQECFAENGEGVAPHDVQVFGDLFVTGIDLVCASPYRSYRFDNQLTQGSDAPLASGEQTGGVLYRWHTFGENNGVPLGSIAGYGTLPRFATTDLFQVHIDDEGAEGVVYSNDSGKTFWAAAESPTGPRYSQRGVSYHNLTDLTTWWLFRKESASASLQFEVSEAFLLGFDDTHAPDATGRLYAEAQLWVRAFRRSEEGEFTDEVFSRHGGVALQGKLLAPGAAIDWSVFTAVDSTAALGLWTVDDFFFDLIGDEIGREPERVALAFLVDPIPIPIDISAVPVGAEFYVNARTVVLARNSLSPEGGSAVFLRDPATFDAGDPASPETLDDPGSVRVLAAEGLTMLAVETLPQPAPDAGGVITPACESNARGTLEFGEPQYRVAEGSENSTLIRVIRTGPTVGPVAARVRIDGDSAEAGEDFEPREIEVRFGAGDTIPRTLELPIVDDDVIEPDENLTVTLLEPQGCADLGAQSTAAVTIADDDTSPEPEAYTLGGTVAGLVGTGLTLTNLSTNDLPIANDGAFMFPRTFATGSRYEVRVAAQPTQPRQFCSLANGSGVIGTADVDNVLVSCTTLPEGTTLDPSFGVGGRVTPGGFPAATDMAVQSDGKIVLVGRGRLGRFNEDGTVDTSFGTNGAVPVQTYGALSDVLHAVDVQPDGHIVIAGSTRNGANSPTFEDWIVARYEESGAADATFARAIVNFARGDEAHGVLLRPDGSVVVTGTASVLDSFGVADANFAAIRLLGDGTIDNGFGLNGNAIVNVAGRSDHAYAAALQPDGKIVLAGRVADSGGADPDIGLARFNADGTPDAGFGVGGVLRDETPGSWDEAADVVLQPDGKILVVGHADGGVVARYNADGTPDRSFGTAGRATEPLLGLGRAIALQPDGRILAAGVQGGDFAIVRFTELGQLDTTFGTNGVVEVDFFGGSDDPAELIVQPDGRILVAGSATNGTRTELALVRLVP